MTPKRSPAELLEDRDKYDYPSPVELLQRSAAEMVIAAVKSADLHGFGSGFTEGTSNGIQLAVGLLRGESAEEQEEMCRYLATKYGFELKPLAPEGGNGK